MKKALLIAAAVMFVATSVFAQPLPAIGYIGVYADGDHLINNICPPAYSPFDAWIWILPSEDGMQAAEWAVSFPGNVVTTFTAQHPNITVALGTLPTGISVAFGEGQCNMGWVWTHHLSMLALAAIPAKIEIIPHPTTQPPAYQVATCELGYPLQPLIYLTPLYLCTVPDGELGVQQTNWGAIKSLF